jgi:RsiW-degrading membrane proteinase PrsW (M82 family)
VKVVAPAAKAASIVNIDPTTIIVIGLVIFIVVFYFLPTFIAYKRNHKNTKSIFVINFFFGFTFLGWLAALIWALNSSAR